MDISIVIPVFEESIKIKRDIHAASGFVIKNQLVGEIIIVDDGSRDDTARAAEEAGANIKTHLKVIRYSKHRGKGFAVKTGILSSRGKYVMFIDSGLCVPYNNSLVGLNFLKGKKYHIAHASRKLNSSTIHKPQPIRRRIMGTIMHRILITWLRVPSNLTDTQCGLKIYRGNVARELYGECLSTGFLFDVEIILRAVKKGYRIIEFPIEWTVDPDSRLNPIKNFISTISEMMAIKKLHLANN